MDCENNESVEKFKSLAEGTLGEKYEVNIEKSRKPRIRIVGISDDTIESEVVNKLKRQNEVLSKNEVSLKAFFRGRANSLVAIIEVELEVFKAVMKEGRLRLGWDYCKVYEGTYLKRCYKCLGFQHVSQDCTRTANKKCHKCAEEHNDEYVCNVKVFKCTNCMYMNQEFKLNLNINHSAFDVDNCEVYKRKFNVERKKIF